jgi:hypothetical protein
MSDAPRAGATRAVGHIEVRSYDALPYDTQDGAPTLCQLTITEVFTGDIVGEGSVRFLQALRDDQSASYCGIERVRASIGARSGAFLLQDTGTLDNANHVSGTWFVVPGSGTDGLKGLRGEGSFSAILGQHASYVLDYWFE